jgi:hypothetical protein
VPKNADFLCSDPYRSKPKERNIPKESIESKGLKKIRANKIIISNEKSAIITTKVATT